MKPNGGLGWDVFTFTGFRNWKKDYAFLNHIGDDPCSPHNNVVRSCDELKKYYGHND